MWRERKDVNRKAALVMGEYAMDTPGIGNRSGKQLQKFSAGGALFVGAIATVEIVILGAMLLGIDFLTADFIAVILIAMLLYCGIVALLTDK